VPSEPPRRPDHPTADPAVHLEGVEVRFGGTVAVAGVDLEMPEGQILGLLGPNGAGKTTIVKVLATLLRPTTGSARVLGADCVDEAATVRERIALSGQFAAVDELLSGRQNLELFGRLFGLATDEAARRAGELLDRFDLAHAADRQVDGWSGGMRRRLDLASSLLRSPRVVFLDEPTTGLDPRSRNGIWRAVRELADDGTTVLLTTQNLEEADALADRIVVMREGRIIADGSALELKDRAGGRRVRIVPAERGDGSVADRLAGALGDAGLGPRLERADGALELWADDDPLALLGRVAGALERSADDVLEVGLRRPTLDDVFLQLTGDRSDDADAPAEAAA
jgi:daunorubicin resistance ABC transporter ATP-binding subunit